MSVSFNILIKMMYHVIRMRQYLITMIKYLTILKKYQFFIFKCLFLIIILFHNYNNFVRMFLIFMTESTDSDASKSLFF